MDEIKKDLERKLAEVDSTKDDLEKTKEVGHVHFFFSVNASFSNFFSSVVEALKVDLQVYLKNPQRHQMLFSQS